MFYFGDHISTAELYLSAAQDRGGPEIPSLEFEELDEFQQGCALTFAYTAYRLALRDGAEEGVISILRDKYDEVFEKIAKAQPAFVTRLDQRRVKLLPDHSIATRNKYRKLAGLPPVA